VHQAWIFEFNDLVNGSFTIKRQMSGDFISWRNANPTNYLANWDAKVHRVVVSATGDLRGFHFSDFDNILGTRWWWAIGHFSPRDSNPLP